MKYEELKYFHSFVNWFYIEKLIGIITEFFGRLFSVRIRYSVTGNPLLLFSYLTTFIKINK